MQVLDWLCWTMGQLGCESVNRTMVWVLPHNPDEDDTACILATETCVAFQTDTGHPGREISFPVCYLIPRS